MATGGKIDLSQLRNLVRQYIDKHLYDTALFWADKAVSLSNGDIQDVYWLAHTLFLLGHYHRAIHSLNSRGLLQTDLSCRYLAAKCHSATGEWEQVLSMLDTETQAPGSCKTSVVDTCAKKLESSVSLLRGMAYEALDNRSLAADCYKDALKLDIHCYEAFNLLITHHMLTAREERELIKSLPFKEQCTAEEIELVKFLYESKLKKYNRPVDPKLSPTLDSLNDNLDVVTNIAERHYYNCHYKTCHKLTNAVLYSDPFHDACLPIHISCLVELKKPNDLFHLAHKLVNNYPSKAVAWYAVGCYYVLVGKFEQARRYFSKATSLERVYGPAWLAFGHAFALEGEHDQAMAAYFTASKLMPGCHLPLLYIGLEYGKTNNSKLAEKFFNQALSIAPEDPFVKHEIGIISFENGDYLCAEKYFKEALKKAQVIGDEVLSDTWEPLLNNLGHVSRKLQNYEESLKYHHQALVLVPQNSSTFSAIAYVHTLMGNNHQAVEFYHKALSLRRDDTFSVQMLSQALELLSAELYSADEIDNREEENSMVIEKGSDEEEND